MKEIKIIIGTLYPINIYIYDINNNLICKKTTNNGVANFCLSNNKVYKIKFKVLNNTYCYPFYVSNSYNNYYFNINEQINNKRIITLLLTDYYYDNLKITKGELIL